MDAPTTTLFDTHVHLDLSPLCATLAATVQAAGRAGVGRFLVPGVAPGGWEELLATVAAVPGAWAAPGVHPQAAAHWDDAAETALAALLERPEVVAIGEIGLDNLLERPSLAVQKRAFCAQLRLAREAGLPVLIHCRRAIGPLLQILREERADAVGGILHAFSGSVESAQQAIDLGFAIAFGGTLTYPNARRPVEVLEAIPETAIVLETDAPDLAPHPHRGAVGRPAWLALIAAEVARIRNWTREDTARITTANALRVLKIENGKQHSASANGE